MGFWNPKPILHFVEPGECLDQQMKPASWTRKFCKTASCPSSETLLEYRRHLLTITERLMIDHHVRECDFCSAETHLLTRHQVDAEVVESVEIPSHLRELANSLFNRPMAMGRMSHLVVHSPLSH